MLKKILFMSVLILLSAEFLATAEAAGQAVIQSHTGYMDAVGWYHVIGEVKNTGDGALQYVKITATFYDSSDTVVATSFTFTMIEILHAGQKSPFDLILLDKAQSAKVDHYEVGITYQQSGSLSVGLEILSHSKYVDAVGWMHVVGEIKNTGNKDAHYVKIAATFYDSAGKVVGVAFAYSDPSDLTPGQKAPFQIILLNKEQSNLAATYALEAQSNEYNVIPEFPVVALILPVALLLAVAVLRVRVLHKRSRAA